MARHLPGVQIFAKGEWLNPGGSVKDRAGLRIIEDGERSGQLTRDKIILDSTSGNTGIAYAMIGAVKGYRVELVVPANLSDERKKTLLAYGANLIFTDPVQGSDGALLEAQRIYEKNPDRYFKGDQYNNSSNWKAHYDTTGVEILQPEQREGHPFCCRRGDGRHIDWNREKVEGVSLSYPDLWGSTRQRVPWHRGSEAYRNGHSTGIYDDSILDGTFYVKTEDAYGMAIRLAKEEGLLVGPSSGAAFWAALKLAETIGLGLIVTIFPDGGDRYFSTVHKSLK